MVDIYVEYMSTVATLLGTKCNTTSKMREIIEFEKQLAKVSIVMLYHCMMSSFSKNPASSRNKV